MMATAQTADALYGTGRWLMDQDRHEDARHVFRTMLVVTPTDERGWLALGACHESAGEVDKAEMLYTLAPSACGRAPRCLIARARLVRAGEREDEALALYLQAAQIADDVGDEDAAAIARTEGARS